jgi:hypothetical protein
MSCRSRSNRLLLLMAGFAVQGLLNLGAPADAHAQTQAGVAFSSQTQSGAPPKSWRQRHPVLFDTLVGTAAGAAAGCALGAAAHDSEVSCSYLVAPFGLLGATIGVVPGLATERRNARDPLSFDEVRLRVKPGMNVVAVNAAGHKTAGKVADVSGDSVTMRAIDGTTATLTSRASTWHLVSDSLKNGILIGAAVGTAAAVVNYKDGAGAGAITGVPIWALIGALADRAFNHQVLTVDEHAGSPSAFLKLSPRLGKRSGGIALSVTF